VVTDVAFPPGDSSISWTAPVTNDDYQELIAHLVATLS
jgi:hypothetical protein